MRQFTVLVAAALACLSVQAQASLTLTITQDSVNGGTLWAFSNGSGTIGSSTPDFNFLVGNTAANAAAFFNGGFKHDGSLQVVGGTNAFDIHDIFVANYGGLSGTNGNIFDGMDFQGSGTWTGASIANFNGLVLHADAISYLDFNAGTYSLNSYYSYYGSNFGAFTLQIGATNDTPEPSALALAGAALMALAWSRRGSRTV